MRNLARFTLSFVSLVSMFLLASEPAPAQDNVYACKANNIDGKLIDFSQYKGKALLIVNVASQCGATDQYKGLQEINLRFKDKGLVVMAFPTNEFGGQETGSNDEIKSFCKTNYQVTFPLFAKSQVKGENKNPVFKYLTTAKNPDRNGEVGWNFEKFLVDKDGKLKRRFTTSVDPYDKEFITAIQKVLE